MTLIRPTPSDCTRFWMVQAVFDPEGRGGDLSDRSRTKDTTLS